jgi:2-polyprenyl-6-methoxyphenol hydroxylase-like FAD-dependent oxidoreductase
LTDRKALDVLIVGAGPTGLALAAQLQLFGTRFRIIDRSFDRTRESRALGMQARTLEVLDAVGLGEALAERGSSSTRLVLHFGARVVASVQLGDVGVRDTRFPFILFISQADTERLIVEHLAASGVIVERGVELVRFEQHATHVDCVLRHEDGREEQVRVSALVGCDGAHSAVRKAAGFAFEGGSYPQDFVLGDVEADGPLEAGAINSFVGGGGVAMIFPLGSPATWRVIAMRAASPDEPPGVTPDESPLGPLTLAELQAIVAQPTANSVMVRDPVWLTRFRLHHRQIAHYRQGRIFLAGDAAHIHSPVGAQGMNTGIQDAWNLGWKLALVARGTASPDLLNTYDAERWPVGRFLLRYTDRVFSTFTRALSGGRIATWAREVVISRILPRVLRSARLRRAAFRFVSELGITYRGSPAVSEGHPRLRGGPRAGDRLPDARVTRDGRPASLQREVIGPHFALLLCGDPRAWDPRNVDALASRHTTLLRIIYLSPEPGDGVLCDDKGEALKRLGARDAAQYLVRPDGYIAFRSAGRDFQALERYLDEWFPVA